MTEGANLVYFGPYRFSQRAVNALEKYGVEDPDDLNNFTMTELRAIPGFGNESMIVVRAWRAFNKSQEGEIDLSLDKPEEPPPPPQINICLQVTKTGSFRLRHYEWVQNMIKNFQDPGNGIVIETESDFIAYLISVFYGADPTKGGTRGVSTAKGDPNTGQASQDFTPNVSLT